MKLNNKGFAISGILYTTLVLFLMILVSLLANLTLKRKTLDRNLDEIREDIEEVCKRDSFLELVDNSGYLTPYNGKYIMTVNGNNEKTCEIYLKVGVVIPEDISTIQNMMVKKDCLDGVTSVTSTTIIDICTTDKIS